MAAVRPAFEELEHAFRDKIAEMRGLIALRQSSASSTGDAETERWLEDLTQIEERVTSVEKLADGLSQEVDEELKQLEQARDIWRNDFYEQNSELDALFNAIPPTMRPTSYPAKTAETAPQPPAAAAQTAVYSSVSSNVSAASVPASTSGSVAAAGTSRISASKSARTSETAGTRSVSQGATKRSARKTVTSTVSQQQPPSKKQCVRGSKSTVAASSATTTTGSASANAAAAAASAGGAMKPKHVTDAEVEKVPKYMRGRLTAEKINEASDELARLIDNRAKLLQLPQSAVARLKSPQSEQYQRAFSLQIVARKASNPPLPKRFVCEADLLESKTLRLDSMGKMLFSTLRHLGVIREFLCDNQKCFTLL